VESRVSEGNDAYIFRVKARAVGFYSHSATYVFTQTKEGKSDVGGKSENKRRKVQPLRANKNWGQEK
jgi:hypothetical protein